MLDPTPKQRSIRKIVLVLVPRFSSLELTALTKVCQLVNRELGKQAIEWAFASQSGGVVESSDGITVETVSVHDVARCDVAIVVASFKPLENVSKAFLDWLRYRQRHGTYLAAVESGTFLLAKAGVLGDHAPALHQEDVSAFKETWPDCTISDKTLNLDEGIASSAGCVSTFDLALSLVMQSFGPRMAEHIARIIYYESWRSEGARTQPDRELASTALPVLKRCRSLMMSNIETPLTISEICERLDVDERQLHRLFRKATNTSPLQYYKTLRLTEAHFILINSDMSVTDVGMACGYSSGAAFAKAFREYFGYPPSKNRNPYMGFLPSSSRPAGASLESKSAG